MVGMIDRLCKPKASIHRVTISAKIDAAKWRILQLYRAKLQLSKLGNRSNETASLHSASISSQRLFPTSFRSMVWRQVALVSEGAYSVFGGPNSGDDTHDQHSR